MDQSKIVITGANGQLGTALRQQYPQATALASADLDISNAEAVAAYAWPKGGVILNAAAYTNVDGAETDEGRVQAWKVNATAVRNLARAAAANDQTLVHVSSEYVFEGTQSPHSEDEPLSPLGVYAATKAAGDVAASLAPKHYIVRTSWVIGEGKNFVRTMISLGQKGIAPTVVADQIGRLTFTSELTRAIDHLLTSNAEHGTYNITNDGDSVSWADLTREIFRLGGFDLQVTDTSTAEYFASKPGVAPRPLQSTLALTKLQLSGFQSRDWREDLQAYVSKETQV